MPLPPDSQPSAQLRHTLSNSALLRYLLLFGCGWATVALINYFYGTIALFTAAGLFAALLNYPVVWLSRYIPRGWAVALTFMGAIALLIAAVLLIGLEVLNQGQSLLIQLRDALKQQTIFPFQEVLNQLDIGKVIGTLQAGLASGLGIVQSIFSSVFTGVFGAVISLYMLIDGKKLWHIFLKLVPVASRDRFAQTFRHSFLGFLRGQLLLMLFLSIATFIVFTLLGVNYALILAVIIGVLDAIPGIGATLGVLIVTLLVFASQGGAVALKVVIACIVLQQIQDNFVHPKVMGDALELNPVLLFLAIFIGERVAGLLGVFLAIPLAGMIAAWMRSIKEEPTPLPEEPLIESH
ncbi:AI-2E family transporter (plasmid) [Kovacikia minuta CCNUW1]|uniref:AI-2E family transporter n=1 Tax=Kovacikia minuta TaxID=2931930 RepID=UPI001CCA7FF4|nr:AI-2E family transporter [Kovacikia minuta]UBF30204.1 AI-2E family transporter [Kovacikia minuta CCNUW1]